MILKLFKKLDIKYFIPDNCISRKSLKASSLGNGWYSIPYYAINCNSGMITIGYYEGEGISTLDELKSITGDLEPVIILSGTLNMEIEKNSEKYLFEKTLNELDKEKNS